MIMRGHLAAIQIGVILNKQVAVIVLFKLKLIDLKFDQRFRIWCECPLNVF